MVLLSNMGTRSFHEWREAAVVLAVRLVTFELFSAVIFPD